MNLFSFLFKTITTPLLIFVIGCCNVDIVAQPFKVLHYTETSGFDHQTRGVSLNMFQSMGMVHGFTVDDDNSGNAFNSLNNLLQYDVIIFSNTSGNNILDSAQQQHFMQYMNNGRGFIGIHAASDTYRHSSANGSNTGSWDWYAELVGASVQENPNHVNGTPVYRIDAMTTHPLIANIPDPWFKAEEYYYWEGGYFDNTNNVLLQVEETVGPNGLVNSYDSARAVCWFRELSGGARVFYTSLGHDASNFTSDTNFYNLLQNAVLWAGNATSVPGTFNESNVWHLFPNPCGDKLTVSNNSSPHPFIVNIVNLHGVLLKQKHALMNYMELDLKNLDPGIYIVKVNTNNMTRNFKLIKK